MNYMQIRKMDISNGTGVGASIFVSGCPIHCKNCFNKVAWPFDAGKPFTEEVKEEFLDLCDKPWIDRISILGGEPLCDENYDGVLDLVRGIRASFCEDKKIWIYTGYNFEYLFNRPRPQVMIFQLIDVLVDGPYIDNEKNSNLRYRGSRNQRIIDVKKTLEAGKIVNYLEE